MEHTEHNEHHKHHEHHERVEIFIDKKRHEAHNPSTGETLYHLGTVNHETHDLYQEVHGKGEDKLIPFNHVEHHLKHGEHFFSVQKKLNPGAAWR